MAQQPKQKAAEKPPAPPAMNPGRTLETDPTLIDAPKAIRIAEQFVHDNGYTEFEPPDASKLVPESVEFRERKDWISQRHDTLRPRALGFLSRSLSDPDGWTVGFEYVRPEDRGYGRAVTMDGRGGHIRMQHKELSLKFLQPRAD